jgi:hypothetical protein
MGKIFSGTWTLNGVFIDYQAIQNKWTLNGVFIDYQNIGSSFPYSVSFDGFADDNPQIQTDGFISSQCPYRLSIRAGKDGRDMLVPLSCSSKIISSIFSYNSGNSGSFPYSVSFDGFADDNPQIQTDGFISSQCPYRLSIRAGKDGRNMLVPLSCSSKIISSNFSFLGIPKCAPDSCRVDCAGAPDGFCCIDNSFTDRLLQIIKS